MKASEAGVTPTLIGQAAIGRRLGISGGAVGMMVRRRVLPDSLQPVEWEQLTTDADGEVTVAPKWRMAQGDLFEEWYEAQPPAERISEAVASSNARRKGTKYKKKDKEEAPAE